MESPRVGPLESLRHRRASAPGVPRARSRAGPDTDGGRISPHGRTPVRAQDVSPARGGRVACPDRDAVSPCTAFETASDDRPRLEHGRTRAVPSACLSFSHGGQARTPTGLDWSCRHPIPCCRGRGTVSTIWCVSAGRTPVSGLISAIEVPKFDPERPNSCGCVTKRTRFSPSSERDARSDVSEIF